MVYTPAFDITKKLLSGHGKNEALKSLVSKISRLSEEEIAKELKGIFLSIQRSVELNRVNSFLNQACQLMRDQDLAANLERIKKITDPTERERELRDLLVNESLMAFFARYLKNESAFNKDELLDAVNQSNLKISKSDFEKKFDQAVYGSPEAFLARQVIQLLFQICDIAFINAGLEPVFTSPSSKKEEEGDKVRFLPMPK